MKNECKTSISLVSVGRCGSSALESVFSKIPGINALGETGDVIHEHYYNIKLLISKTNLEISNLSIHEAASRSTRDLFVSTYGLNALTHWLHKPTGLPDCYKRMIQGGSPISEVSEIYWKTFNSVVSSTKFVTSLRDPCDNLLSIASYTGEPIDVAAVYYFAMLYIISACPQKVHAVDFRNLNYDPEQHISRIFNDLEIPFDPGYLDAISVEHAENKVNKKTKADKYRSYAHLYGNINKVETLYYLDRSYDLCEQIGVSFQRPDILSGVPKLEDFPGSILFASAQPRANLLDGERLAILEVKLARSEMRCVAMIDQIAEQRAWIDNLEGQLFTLKAWLDELQAAKDWLDAQYKRNGPSVG